MDRNGGTGSSSPGDGAVAAGAGCEPPFPSGNVEGRGQQCTGLGQLRPRDSPSPTAIGRACQERAGNVPCCPSSAELRPRRAGAALGQAGEGEELYTVPKNGCPNL